MRRLRASNGMLLGRSEELDVEEEWIVVGEDVDTYSDEDYDEDEDRTSATVSLMDEFALINHLEVGRPLKRRGDSDRNQRHKRQRLAEAAAANESAKRSTQSLLSFGFTAMGSSIFEYKSNDNFQREEST